MSEHEESGQSEYAIFLRRRLIRGAVTRDPESQLANLIEQYGRALDQRNGYVPCSCEHHTPEELAKYRERMRRIKKEAEERYARLYPGYRYSCR